MNKNYFISMQKGFLALMSAALLFSCSQIEPFEMEGDDVLRTVSIAGIGGGDCNVDCITDDKSTWKVKTYTQDYNDNAGTLTIKVSNSPTEIIYEITSTADIRQVNFNGQSRYASNTPAAQPFVIKEPLGEFGKNWDACDTKTALINVKRNDVPGDGGGVSQSINTSYNLIGVCDDCEDSFSYVKNTDGSYTFTYVSEEDINDAELAFTFAQGVVVGGLESWRDAGVTKQLTIDIVSCTTYEWTVSLNADCGGGGQQFANLWTDFKVNEDSQKGDLDNIVKPCN